MGTPRGKELGLGRQVKGGIKSWGHRGRVRGGKMKTLRAEGRGSGAWGGKGSQWGIKSSS